MSSMRFGIRGRAVRNGIPCGDSDVSVNNSQCRWMSRLGSEESPRSVTRGYPEDRRAESVGKKLRWRTEVRTLVRYRKCTARRETPCGKKGEGLNNPKPSGKFVV